jgi:hypothetical protein
VALDGSMPAPMPRLNRSLPDLKTVLSNEARIDMTIFPYFWLSTVEIA